MPAYVLLEHDHPERHWDFMLEADGALLTWRLPRPPTLDGVPMSAMKLADHRLAYLDYEGPVSGQRGTVTRHERGTYVAAADGSFLLHGDGGRWRVVLRHVAGAAWELSATAT